MNIALPIFFASLSALFYGLESGVSKRITHLVGSRGIVFGRTIVSLISSILFLLIFINKVHFSITGILATLGTSVLYFSGMYLYLKSLGKGSAGVMMSINSSKLLVTVFASYLIFGHKLSTISVISIIIIISGLLFVGIENISKGKINFVDGITEGVISVLIGGLAASVVKIPISLLGVYLYAVITQSAFLIFSYLLVKDQLKDEEFVGKIKTHKLVLLQIGIFAALGFFFFNQSIAFGDVNLVNGILTGQIIVASLYEYIAFKTKLTRYKYLGILFVFIGIFSLAYFW